MRGFDVWRGFAVVSNYLFLILGGFDRTGCVWFDAPVCLQAALHSRCMNPSINQSINQPHQTKPSA